MITLWFVLLIYGSATATRFTMLSGWYWLVPGLFAQAGVAEEALFRAYLFGHLRTSRTFWRATAIALLPFVAVHLTMFVTMPWPIALAGVALSVASVPPFAWLYELDGHTVWAPALLHAVIQGTVKVVIPDGASSSFVLAWMVASAIVPWAALLVRGAAPATGAGSHPVRTGVPGATSPALRQRVS